MVYLKTESYLGGKPILFGQTASRTPYSVAVKASDIIPDINGKRTVPEGSFVASVNGEIRFLPRAKMVTELPFGSSNSFLMGTTARFFKPGDVVYSASGCSFKITGTPVAGQIVHIRIGNSYYSFVVSASPTLATVVTQFTNLTVAEGIFENYGTTQSNNGVFGFSSKDFYTIRIAANSGIDINIYSLNGIILQDSISPLGTIESVTSTANPNEYRVKLTSSSPQQVRNYQSLTVLADKLIGIYPEPLDFTKEPVKHIAPIFHADGVYEKNLPYCDLDIKRQLHGLNIEKRFYANT